MTRIGFFLLLMAGLSGPPLFMLFHDFHRPDVGDPSKPLVDNLMAQPGQRIGGAVAVPMDQLSRYASARDNAVKRLNSPHEGLVAAWCDAEYAERFRSKASDYFSQKVRVVSEVLEKHGEGQARRIEAHWMNAAARSAEAMIRDAMVHRAVVLDDLGHRSRIEGRRLAVGLQPRLRGCAA
jgi:hypothetical protein